MNTRAIGFGIALAIAAGTGLVVAQTPATTPTTPTTIDGFVSAAKAAAGTDWSGTFLRLCIPPPPSGRGAAPAAGAAAAGRAGNAANAGAAAAGRAGAAGAAAAGRAGRGAAPAANAAPGGPARDTWYAEPAKVADNLYFLGTKVHSAWALVGSEGIIVFEALFDYAAPDEIWDGMRKLGLDFNKVKYVVISHAHGDHDGGAPFLQDKLPAAHIVYGGPDWDAVDRRTSAKAKRDTVGTDGMKLSVGDASVQIVTMPGHTAGTLSFLFEAKDGGRPLRVAYVGGTAIPFDGDAAYYDQYLASSRKMAKAATDFGATVLLSNHTEFDNGYYKAHTAANRKAAGNNPFDVGRAGVDRYFRVVEGCTTAAKLRATGKP